MLLRRSGIGHGDIFQSNMRYVTELLAKLQVNRSKPKLNYCRCMVKHQIHQQGTLVISCKRTNEDIRKHIQLGVDR